MEEKVMSLEAESEAVAELGGSGLEDQFAALEAGSDVDEELAAMKAAQIAGTPEPQALPSAATTQSSPSDVVVDAELEELRSQLKEL